MRALSYCFSCLAPGGHSLYFQALFLRGPEHKAEIGNEANETLIYLQYSLEEAAAPTLNELPASMLKQLPELTITQQSELRSGRQVHKQMQAYLQGRRYCFHLPLRLYGSEFQIRAWRSLQRIPYGSTLSYQGQAQACGSAKLQRAVGQANHRNPIAIIVPCHRVIAKNGSHGGYAGGLEQKQLLLELEASRKASTCKPASVVFQST